MMTFLEHSSVLSAVKAASSHTLSTPNSTVCRHYHTPRILGVETGAVQESSWPRATQPASGRAENHTRRPGPRARALNHPPGSGALSPALSTSSQYAMALPQKTWLMGPRGPAFSRSSTGWTWAAPPPPSHSHSTLSEASPVWVLWPKMNRRLTLEGTPPVMEAHRYGNGS